MNAKYVLKWAMVLEGELTDAMSSVIINNFVLPNFREGNYQKGIVEAVHAIIKVITENDSDFLFESRKKLGLLKKNVNKPNKKK